MARRGIPDIRDPSFPDLFRVSLAAVMVSGITNSVEIRGCRYRLMRGALAELVCVRVTGNENYCKWFCMLFLRGAEVADLVWGPGGHPPGCERVTLPPEVAYAEAIVSEQFWVGPPETEVWPRV